MLGCCGTLTSMGGGVDGGLGGWESCTLTSSGGGVVVDGGLTGRWELSVGARRKSAVPPRSKKGLMAEELGVSNEELSLRGRLEPKRRDMLNREDVLRVRGRRPLVYAGMAAFSFLSRKHWWLNIPGAQAF